MSVVTERIARAKEDTTLAEQELNQAIKAIADLPRHQKIAVSKLVEAAIARVRVVRAELAVLEAITAPDEAPEAD